MSKKLHQIVIEQTIAGNIDKEVGLEILKKIQKSESDQQDLVAIIGMSAKFPLSDSIEDFWSTISKGICMITDFPQERSVKINAYKNAKMIKGNYLNGSYLADIDMFDYKLFNLSKREASTMSPSQRIMLEVLYDALLDAGYPPSATSNKKIGVFVGHSDDLRTPYSTLVRELQPDDSAMSIPGNLSAIIPSRLSYSLNLKGPSMLIDTACSSFLSALHTACHALQSDCQMAVIGGIKINLLPVEGMPKLGMESSDGYTRTFSNDSDGTGTGEGAGAIVIKSLRNAIEDQDNILGLIKGSVINQDGTTSGITVPNVESQSELLLEAWTKSGLKATDITYIEAHGTGTKLGDPIEIDAITMAASKHTRQKQFCAIGSVKSNLGHLYEGAGAASVIKACLMLKHRQIPPTILFQEPNEKISFENTPVYIADQLNDVSEDDLFRIGINGFGFSGTNCHVILEEYRLKREITDDEGIFTLSASFEDSIAPWAKALLQTDFHLYSMTDICYTQNVRREHGEHRVVIFAHNKADLKIQLSLLADGKMSDQILVPSIDGREGCLERLKINHPLWADCIQQYLSGQDIDWQQLYSKENRVVSLPLCKNKKESCWITQNTSKIKANNTLGSQHWLIDNIVEHSDNGCCYLTSLTSNSNPIISDHRVMNINMLPGTAYVEMIHHVMKEKLYNKHLHIADLELLIPVQCSENNATEIYTHVSETEENQYNITFFSVDHSNSDSRITHAQAKAQISSVSEYHIPERMESITGLVFSPIDQSELTEGFIEFGPRWGTLSIAVCEQSSDISWAHVQTTDHGFDSDFRMLHLHPSVMDMAVNARALSMGQPYLPYRYNSIDVFNPLTNDVYSRFVTYKGKNDEVIKCDLMIWNVNGSLALKIDGYMVKRVGNLNMLNAAFSSQQLYQPSWTEKDFSGLKPESCPEETLIIKVNSKAEPRLTNGLTEILTSTKCIDGEMLINSSETYWNYPKLVVLDLSEDQMIKSGINLGNTAKERLVLMFRLMKQLNSLVTYSCRIAVIGKSVYSYKDAPECNPITASCFAMIASCSLENPFISTVFLDVDNETEALTYTPFIIQSAENKYKFIKNHCFMDSFEFVGEQSNDAPSVVGKNILITGGLGGIGMSLAQYFAEQGAAGIVAVSRSSLHEIQSPERMERTIRIIEKIESYGTSFYHYRVDICDAAELHSQTETIHNEVGKVSVVVHCAGVPGKGMLSTKNEEEFIRVIMPKVIGTSLLYDSFHDEASEMYLMSSVASITGIAGQSDYSAANAFLDGFSALHGAGAFRVKSLNWPSWSEVGMAQKQDFVIDTFMKTITPVQAARLFQKASCQQEAQIIAGEWNPAFLRSVHSRMLERTSVLRFLKRIESSSITPKKLKDRALTDVKLTGRTDDKYTLSEKMFAKLWASVLDASEIDIYTNFYDMGGNSILASYLVKELESEYPGVFDITDVFTYSTVYKLSEYYDTKIKESSVPQLTQYSGEKTEEALEDVLEKLASGEISIEEASKFI